jgi:hypothetical protein
MFSLTSSHLRSASGTCLILGLAACTDLGLLLVLPSPSFAGQPNVSPCQKSPLVSAAADVQSSVEGVSTNGLLLAQAQPMPSQPVGAELGEPACTYDPVVPAAPPIIRGLW